MQAVFNGALSMALALITVTIIGCVLGLMNTPR